MIGTYALPSVTNLTAYRLGPVVYGIIARQTLLYSPNWSKAENPPSPTYVGRWAKKLAIGGLETEDVIRSYLTNFRHLIDLALWTRIPTERFFKALEGLQLIRLSTKLESLNVIHLRNNKVWGSVTHLDITRFHPRIPSGSQTSATQTLQKLQKEWKDLEHLPSLTHLAINELVTLEDISDILSACTKLELLVIFRHSFLWHFPAAATDAASSPLRDPRVVLMSMKRYMVDEWYAGAVGERDFWQDAMDRSDARKRMLIFLFFFQVANFPIGGEFLDGTEWLVREVGLN